MSPDHRARPASEGSPDRRVHLARRDQEASAGRWDHLAQRDHKDHVVKLDRKELEANQASGARTALLALQVQFFVNAHNSVLDLEQLLKQK